MLTKDVAHESIKEAISQLNLDTPKFSMDADMSFHNPNAFYELAIRHMLGKPIVHIIRKRDRLPFDVGNFRTILIDDEDKYDLIAKLDSYRADIANYVREALEGSSSSDNPILTYFPDIRVTYSNDNK